MFRIGVLVSGGGTNLEALLNMGNLQQSYLDKNTKKSKNLKKTGPRVVTLRPVFS